jgi:DMSO/TMAO reductase YedYZ molybdopterin-dependent catalytic subunit
MEEEPDWVHGHPHEPNPTPPDGDGQVTVVMPGGNERIFTVEDLHALPYTEVHNCMIVSTGHGTTGPFAFGGVRLADLVARVLPPGTTWYWVDVAGADGFGARLTPVDLDSSGPERPIILAHAVNGLPLDRARGLVRLIVPGETGDALRQVKWVDRLRFVV